MKIGSRLISFLFIGFCVLMLGTDFHKACTPKSSDLSCVFLTGQIAKIDSPANIEIFAYEPFTISYFDSNGKIQKVTPPSVNGWSIVNFNITGPTSIMMLKSKSGMNFPIIRVEQSVAESYPSLEVTRTWVKPFVQFVQWNLFPVFMYSLLSALLFFLISFTFN